MRVSEGQGKRISEHQLYNQGLRVALTGYQTVVCILERCKVGHFRAAAIGVSPVCQELIDRFERVGLDGIVCGEDDELRDLILEENNVSQLSPLMHEIKKNRWRHKWDGQTIQNKNDKTEASAQRYRG